MTLKIINGIVFTGLILGALVYLNYYLKKVNGNKLRESKLITVIDEGVNIGFGNKVSIIKVGDEHFLVGNGNNGMTFQKIDGKMEKIQRSWEETLNVSKVDEIED